MCKDRSSVSGDQDARISKSVSVERSSNPANDRDTVRVTVPEAL